VKRFIKVACLGGAAIALLIIVPLMAHQDAARARKDSQSEVSASPPSRRFESGLGRTLKVHSALPVGFEPNHGQADERVRFLSRDRGYTLFLTASEVVLVLGDHLAAAKPYARSNSDIVRIKFVNANPAPSIIGLDALPGKSNYFMGNDAKRWQTGIPQYQRVQYRAIYPGIDVIFYRNRYEQLEFDFVIAPGADPKAIQMAFEGATRLKADSSGAVFLRSGTAQVRLAKPVIYQMESGARKPIGGSYRITREGRASFALAAHDPEKPLVIDPVLDYSTYLGGRGADYGRAIAVDVFGHVYVTGWTSSADFPTTSGAYQPTRPRRSRKDAFVAKIDPTNSTLIYSTYLGGTSTEQWGSGIVVDGEGSIYVTGTTHSRDFPVTTGAFQTSLGGDLDIFVTKLNATGSGLVYSTYIGGDCRSRGRTSELAAGIQIDSFGNAYIAGTTLCRSFPTTPGAFQPEHGGRDDAVVAKLSALGDALLYASFLGGRQDENAVGIAVDGAGNVYVAGATGSPDFPTLAASFQPKRAGGFDAFVTKVDPAGSALVYSTYLGGRWSGKKIFGEPLPAFTWGEAIAVDGAGHAYVTGLTDARDFPTTTGSFQPSYGLGSSDAFVTKLSPDGSFLIYSSYLGGRSSGGISGESGLGIAADAQGNVYVTGRTNALNFPTTANVFQPIYGRGVDGFVIKLDSNGSAIYSSYLGGRFKDEAHGVAVDATGNAYVTGLTASNDFPTQNALQPAKNGSYEAFVAKIID
jgi:hypothetical protein